MANRHINVISWNINGCGNPTKRRKVLTYLKSKNTDIVFIQESHIMGDEEAGKFKRGWVGKVFHSSYSSKQNGVMILINKNLSCIILKQHNDKEGRIICIEALINGIRTVLCNIYAPNKEEPDFFHEVNRVIGNMQGQVILAGDFNQVMDGLIDKSKPSGRSSPRDRTAIHMLAEDLSLVDIWRLVNPREREYTFYSHCHKSHSRIDFFLVSNSLIDSVVECEIGAIALSDHAAVELHVDLNTDKVKRGRWRLNTMWLQDVSFCNTLSEDLKSFFEINIGSTETISSVWEASKAYVRGKIIAHTSKMKKENAKKEKTLDKEIRKLEKELASHYTDKLYRTICNMKYQLHDIYNRKAEYALFRLKINFYEGGEKNGRLLARQLRQQDNSNNIPMIKKDNGVVTSSKEINQVFKCFYENLYTSSCAPNPEEITTFFSGIHLPSISNEQKDMLDTPITEEEIRAAISSMKTGKSPGMDGFPVEYYKKFIDILAPILHKVYMEAFERGSLPGTFNDALISLIPKKDRDTSDPSNFRPVSLLGVDCKILTKTLASRLEKILPDIIHGDQVGFIKKRSSVDNMRRLIHLIHMNRSNPVPVAAFSLDAEKAFDRVEWEFLRLTLSKFGLGPGFCNWVKILYSGPRAAVLTNGLISDFFCLSRGTRQGCALSPLLFTMVLEPLAVAIRAEVRIKGVRAGGREHKLFMYADDILAVLEDPGDSLPVLLECIEGYSKLSGYKINWNKSECMPISHTCHSGAITSYGFKFIPSGMKYLGIQLNPNLDEIMLSNMEPLLQKIKMNLDKWGKLKLTLWGKINVIKMVVAPQFNYVSMMLPVNIAPQLFKQYDGIIKDFLWDKKRPRINIKKMWSPREMGGMSLPNVRLYNISFEMSRLIKHWKGIDQELSWIKIEKELTSPFEPLDVLSHGVNIPGHNYFSNPVLSYSKTVWREIHKMYSISHLRQPYASLWHNPAIRIGKKSVCWNQWIVGGIRKFSDLCVDGVLMPFTDIMQKYNLVYKGNFWKYLQIRDCITKGKFSHKKNKLMEVLDLPSTAHRAAIFYKTFNGLREDACKNLRIVWQKDLGCDLSEQDWLNILSNTGRHMREAKGKFIQYKIIHRFYFTPSKLHRMGLIGNNLCWKCQSEIGTFLHVIWGCKIVYPFWEKVVNHVSKWMGVAVPVSPRLCLLGDQTEMPNIHKHERGVLKVGMVTAARTILRLWKSTEAPDVKKWMEMMSEVASYEHMLAKINNEEEHVRRAWERIFL